MSRSRTRKVTIKVARDRRRYRDERARCSLKGKQEQDTEKFTKEAAHDRRRRNGERTLSSRESRESKKCITQKGSRKWHTIDINTRDERALSSRETRLTGLRLVTTPFVTFRAYTTPRMDPTQHTCDFCGFPSALYRYFTFFSFFFFPSYFCSFLIFSVLFCPFLSFYFPLFAFCFFLRSRLPYPTQTDNET